MTKTVKKTTDKEAASAGEVASAVLGRPPKFATPEQMEKSINEYFRECDTDGKEPTPYTVAGLCVALNLTRQGLCEYGDKPEFSDTVKRAKLRIEAQVESRLFGPNATGSIFWLKNHAHYIDRTQHDVTVRTLETIVAGDE